MNKLLAFMIGVLIILPVLAFGAEQKNPLADLPKDMLMSGLGTLSVCAVTDVYGLKRLRGFYEENKNDSTNPSSPAGKAAASAVALHQDLEEDEQFASVLVHALQTTHKMSNEDIMTVMNDLSETTKATLEDKFGSLDNYDDFTKEFANALNTCNTAMEAYIKKITAELKSREAKGDTH